MDIVSILQTGIKIDQDENGYNYNNNDSTYENSFKQAIYFLICDSCYWCASCIKLNAPLICPACDNCKVERIPIADGKIHGFHYDRKPGLVKFFLIHRMELREIGEVRNTTK